LKELDAYQLRNLGGYTPIYPPMKKDPATGLFEVDEQKLAYYKVFLDHAKKFMMDFRVSNAAAAATLDDAAAKKSSIVVDPSKVKKDLAKKAGADGS